MGRGRGFLIFDFDLTLTSKHVYSEILNASKNKIILTKSLIEKINTLSYMLKIDFILKNLFISITTKKFDNFNIFNKDELKKIFINHFLAIIIDLKK